MAMEQNGGSNSLLGKVIGGFFAAIVAPTLTGVAVWYIQKKFDDQKPELPPSAPPQAVALAKPGAPNVVKSEAKPIPEPAKPTPPESASVSSSTAPAPAPAPPPPAEKAVEKDAAKTALASTSTAGALSTVPKSPSATSRPSLVKKKKGQLRGRLFNGIDLTGFDTYLGIPYSGASSTPYGLNNDPEGVFTVQEAELHISGKVFGGLISTREYENYHLIAEYKWGEKKWPPRNDVARLGGIVLHATGEPGAVHGWSMAGITCVIGETAAGGLFLSDGMPKPITLHAEAEKLVFKKGPPAIVYRPGRPTLTVHSGYLYGLGWHPPAAAKVPAGKVPKDIAHPVGEWNRLECICEGDRITVILNGTTVNVATKVSQAKGKLFFESQGAEIFFRTINVRPLAPAGSVSTPAKPARP
jgi:hypothetical protein